MHCPQNERSAQNILLSSTGAGAIITLHRLAAMELFPAIFFAALVAAVVCISGSHLISGGHQ
jgi:hypothetical protein